MDMANEFNTENAVQFDKIIQLGDVCLFADFAESFQLLY
ncbi:hypothetical protein [Vibrio vulnificus YJ016]|uniref:Uncharacterized protein n=1 Tax=Vibrio vulnificus (strain YJ016) TaxID=196600 RepID=Q7MEG3_VIBVY|nr:hypothetical protein [Vibrio vulnificus YJ016]